MYKLVLTTYIILSLFLTVKAARPTLLAASQLEIPKRECRLYQDCDLKLDLNDSLNMVMSTLNSSNTKIFKFERTTFNETNKHEKNNNIRISPVQVGRAFLKMIAPNGSEIVVAEVVITRPYRGIDIAFDVFLWVYVGLVSFSMGAAIHRDLIRDFLTGNRQKEVGLTFICQYFIMPILAYGITKVFDIKPMQSLTLFIYGCCPSSFESTKWSEIFKGDVDLNKFSSLTSTIFALVMMPAWIYTLGDGLMEAAGIRLSLTGLALNMCVLIAPVILGFLLSWLIPDLRLIANIANKLIHSMIFIAIFLTLILCSRLYAFKLGNPLFILIGPMIAFLGYIIGAVIAWVSGFSIDKIKSVSLHTGFQNIVFAFLVVNWNIPSPEVDYILVCLVPVFLQTSLPIKIIFLVQKIKGCVTRRKQRQNKSTKVEIDAEKIEQEPMYSDRS